MAKSKQSSNKRLFILLGILVFVLGLFLYLQSGGYETVYKKYYGYKVRSAFAQENAKIGKPLQALGFQNIEGGESTCEFTEKANYDTEVLDCTVQLQSYMVVGDTKADKDKLNQTVATLKEDMLQNGWVLREDMEMTEWFKNITEGVDYQPDHYNYLYDGDNLFCVLDFFTAFSQPNPPAINATFSCTMPETNPPL